MSTFDARDVRLAFAGGGTGGHILPGAHLLAHVAEKGTVGDVLWFQTGRAVEERAMDGLAARIAPIPLERVALALEPEGGGAPSLGRLARTTLPAVLAARRALQRHRSEVLLGLGGFTSLPAVLAARSLGIPTALLEINAASGRATRWLSPLVSRVLHAWPSTMPERSAPARHRWTGPPLAPSFLAGPPDDALAAAARRAEGFAAERPLLVVLGGSQGALALNRFVQTHLGSLMQDGAQVLHQTGPGRLREGAEDRAGYRKVEYLSDVPRALSAATAVLCRGGASTLAEVAAMARPAWVVPYPHHADRHQERNARELGDGARIVPEERLDESLARELARVVGALGASERSAMTAVLGSVVSSDGALRVWEELLALRRVRTDSARRP